MARQVIEMGAYTSLRTNDMAAFNRYYSHLQSFYTSPFLPPSTEQDSLTGLHLLSLLADSRISEFHTTLESLNTEANAKDSCVTWVIGLEQNIMEGSYGSVRKTLNSPPSEDYRVFVDQIISLIRSEIASCSEKAYTSLPITNLTTILLLKDVKETEAFARGQNWTVQNGRVEFGNKPADGDSMEVDSGMPVHEGKRVRENQLIMQTLAYARELESIV